jgi:hypothetical protein
MLAPTDAVVLLSVLTPDKGRGVATSSATCRWAAAAASAFAQVPPAHVVYFSSDAVYPMTLGTVDESSCADPPTSTPRRTSPAS